MEKAAINKEVPKGEHRNASKLVRPEPHQFAKLLLALTNLILLYFLLRFVFESFHYVFLNLESFFDTLASVSQRLNSAQGVQCIDNFNLPLRFWER